MSAVNTVLVALGAGDSRLGVRLAAIAFVSALPASLLVAVVLAMGPAR